VRSPDSGKLAIELREIAMEHERALSNEALRTVNTRSLWEGPATTHQLLLALLIGWTGISLVSLVLFLIGGVIAAVAALLFVATSAVIGQQTLQLMRAKRDVLAKKDVSILWGLGRLIAWDPVEGVLFLRNKNLAFMDDQLDDGHGGIRCIYPMLGDELALRIPLEMQTLEFADEEVLTREYLSVTIWGSIRWQVTDLKKFYMQVSRELRSTGELADRRQQARLKASPQASGIDTTTSTKLMTAAIEWLRLLAEERTRTVVSRVSSGLLLAERLSDTLSVGSDFTRLSAIPNAIEGAQEPWRSATETLGQQIAETVAEGVRDSGISIARVSLQEIRLPPGIVQAAKEAAQAAYLPLIAERKASEKRADLSVEVDLLGKEAIAAREILGVAPAFTLVDFLSQFVSKQMAAGGTGTGAGVGSLAVGMLAGGALVKQTEGAAPVPNS
jgi:regulator of protease activity HflC (stomatin/prohibitin superfamily)